MANINTAVFTVINTLDSGTGSLRQAIFNANANTSPMSLVEFNIPTSDPGYNHSAIWTISPHSTLPSLTAPTVIDGATAAGYGGKPAIQIDGASAGPSINGLTLSGGHSTLDGLAITDFTDDGVLVNSADNTIVASFLGVDAGGHVAAANGHAGVEADGPNNVIGGLGGVNAASDTPTNGNVVSGNAGDGVLISGAAAAGNLVEGNYIGIDAYGTAALANVANGVELSGTSANTVGGTTVAARNVISGNTQSDVFLSGSAATGNAIEGNYIGTDVTGTIALGNGTNGIGVEVEQGATNDTIGGSAAGDGNLISGNAGEGVNLFNVSNNTVQGNLIGTNAAGTGKLPNYRGIGIYAPSNGLANDNTIGGTTAAERNVISGNTADGVFFSMVYPNSETGNVVEGNYIGTDVTGANALGNGGYGINDFNFADNTIGGTAASAGNVISGNASGGVFLSGQAPLLVAESGQTQEINSQSGATLNTFGADAYSAAVFATDGSVYLADYPDGPIKHFDANGGFLGSFSVPVEPLGLAIGSNGNLYVAISTSAVYQYTPAGALVGGGAFVAVGSGGLNDAKGIAFGPDGDLYVVSKYTNSVLRYDGATGAFLGTFASTGLSNPADLAFGPDGDLYVSSYGNSGVYRYDGPVSATPGAQVGAGAFVSGGSLSGPLGLRFDACGDLDVLSYNGGTNGAILQYNGLTGAFIATLATGIANGNALAIATAGAAVEGNYIGTDVTGAEALPNGGTAGMILTGASGVTVGGATAGARNIISGNVGAGVSIDAASSGNTIAGNYIGTNAAGTAALRNGTNGVEINDSANNTIGGVNTNPGGTLAGAGNLISGNTDDGILVTGTAATGNSITGNFVGTDVTGTTAIANAATASWLAGIEVNGASQNVIGGLTPGARNVISGNLNTAGKAELGVELDGANSSNTVEGNFIGTDVTGAHVRSNTSFQAMNSEFQSAATA